MSVPAERIWIVDHFVTKDDGLGGTEYIPDPAAVNNGMLEIGAILSRVGGVVTLATRRQEISPGRVETVATVVRWRSFVPLERAQEAPPAEQEYPPSGDPDPAAAETPAADPPATPPPVEEPQAA